MNNYTFTAKTRKGKIQKGTIEAAAKSIAKDKLYNQALIPIKLVRVVKSRSIEADRVGISKFIYKDAEGRIQIQLGSSLPSTKELALFTKQFSLMIENGIVITQSLALLKASQTKAAFAQIIGNILTEVEQGATLTEAFEMYPAIFDDLYIAMIRAGEQSGKLDVILRQLVTYIEKSAKIKSQIKSAMAYPIIILVVAIGVITLLLAFVVPGFAAQFKQGGKQLPGITQFVVDASNALVNNWMEITGTSVAAFFLVSYWLKTPSGKILFDNFILKTPLFGDIISKISIGRFCSTMGTMLSSGVNILESLQICSSSSGNKTIENFILTIKEEVQRGESFYTPMSQSPLIPPLVSSMVEVGEATGKLPETLSKVTEIYEDEVDTAIETMTTMIEPIMIVFIGSIVGFIVLAMYMPVFDMASTMG